MLFDLLAPPLGPRGRGKKCAVARPIHVSNSHTKFGWISSNGLGVEAIAISPTLFLKKRGDKNTAHLHGYPRPIQGLEVRLQMTGFHSRHTIPDTNKSLQS